MKKALVSIVVIIILAAGYIFVFGGDKLVLDAPDRVYSMKKPKSWMKTDTIVQSQPSQFGDINMTIKLAESYFGKNALMLVHFTMPEGSDAGRSEKQMLTDSINGMMGSINGKKSALEEIDLQGYTGLECSFHGRKGSTVVFGIVRAFLIERDMVALMSMGTSEKAKTDPDMIALLNTFNYMPK